MSQNSSIRSSITTISPLDTFSKESQLEKIEENPNNDYTQNNKENIRPTEKGRAIKTLKKKTPLNSEEFEAQKYHLESKLRSTYCPKTGNLNVQEKLLAYKNLIKFYDDNNLSTRLKVRDLMAEVIKDDEIIRSPLLDKNDPIFLNIAIRLAKDFMKYERAKSMVAYLRANKFGEKSLEFYLFAGKLFQEAKNFDKAEEIYHQGLYNLPGNAKLLAYYENFKAAKEMYKFEDGATQEVEQQTTNNKKSIGNTRFSLKSSSKKIPHQNINLANQIYQDGDSVGGSKKSLTSGSGKWTGNMPSERNDKENQQKATDWKGKNLKQTYAVKNHETEKISVFVDEDQKNQTTDTEYNKRKVNKKMEGVLTKQKIGESDDRFVKLENASGSKLVEAPISKKKTEFTPILMYPKENCKSGTTFFSIEELRLLNPHQTNQINARVCQKIIEKERKKMQQEFDQKLNQIKNCATNKIDEKEEENRRLINKLEKTENRLKAKSVECTDLQENCLELQDKISNLETTLKDKNLDRPSREKMEEELENTYHRLNYLNAQNQKNHGYLDVFSQEEEDAIPDNENVRPQAEISDYVAMAGLGDESIDTKLGDGPSEPATSKNNSGDIGLRVELFDFLEPNQSL